MTFARGPLFGALVSVVAAFVLSAAGGAQTTPVPIASVAPVTTPSPSVTAPAPEPSISASPGARPIPTISAPAPLPNLQSLFGGGAPLPMQNYLTFVRGADRLPGVIDLIRKDDELYFDLRPENFDKPYIILPSLATGVNSTAFAGRSYDPLVITFKRVGKRILWITPNSRYVADKGSSAAASLAISVADSVIQSTAIVAEDTAKGHIVVSPAIFLTDFLGIGADLGRGVAPAPSAGLVLLLSRPSFGIDASKSYYLRTKAFPRNDEISVNLAFNGPANALPTVPDGRGIPIVVHYSIVAPPDHDPSYVPRYADDRVGYFITARKRYGDDAINSPFERFIERWNLARGPIVFTLTNEIPPAYRGTVRRGILAWNAAFAKIGYPNAIEVRDAPSDPNWDAEDARYNSVRWITSDTPDFAAYSPHISDPDTGQIIRASVVIDGESLRSIREGYVDRVLPITRARTQAFGAAAGSLESRLGEDGQLLNAQACDFAPESVNQAALGMSVLAANPRTTPADRERYAQAWLFSTVMHEAGHTLGLRHNFQGSTAFTYAQLHDPAFTRAHSTTASVMDYTPANIAGPGERQADFFPTKLGKYDDWAIDYGYAKSNAVHASDELGMLRRIAARSTEPGLAYGPDEDAIDVLGIDPRITRFDLSTDPLRYAEEENAIDSTVARSLTRSYAGDTRSFQDLRQIFITVLNSKINTADRVSKYIGGIYTSREHRDQRVGPPFRSIARSEQKRAFDLLARTVLSRDAFDFPPALLNSVAPSRFGLHWHVNGIARADFPIQEVVAEIQDSTISGMFNPTVMARIADQSLKAKPGETMDLADLFTWSNAAIFDDLSSSRIAPLHRELQRRFADLEIVIAFLPSSAMDGLGLPRELQSLARYELRMLRPRVEQGYRASTDVATRAHLDDLRSRIDGALHPSALRAI